MVRIVNNGINVMKITSNRMNHSGLGFRAWQRGNTITESTKRIHAATWEKRGSPSRACNDWTEILVAISINGQIANWNTKSCSWYSSTIPCFDKYATPITPNTVAKILLMVICSEDSTLIGFKLVKTHMDMHSTVHNNFCHLEVGKNQGYNPMATKITENIALLKNP